MVAVTAVTAQDTCGVRAVAPISPRMVRAQIAAALEDVGADAVKIGMLATAQIVRTVAAALAGYGRIPLVVDPVLRSTTGRALLDDAGQRALAERLLPLADLITPNLPEAEALLGRPIRGIAGMVDAARGLRELGARAVLLKGGHRRGDAVDVFAGDTGTVVLRAPRLATANTRGTGCVMSTACACFLAQGFSLPEVARRAKILVSDAIRNSYPLGDGRGPVNPTAARRAAAGALSS
jgi:hydroxymethylpyrimidine/phosphomethylpyrimidine kinase